MKIKISTALTGLLISLSFINANAQDVPNGGFETWLPALGIPPYEEPQDWFTSNSSNSTSVTRSIESSSGLFAAKLTTIVTESDTVLGQLFSIENIPGLIYQKPGFAISPNVISLTGNYKYLPQGDDVAFIAIYITKNIDGVNQLTGYGTMGFVQEVTEYQDFELPIIYLQDGIGGDSALVLISSGSTSGSVTNGTSLFIDGLSVLTTTGLEYAFNGSTKKSIQAFPNPANQLATLNYWVKNNDSEVKLSVMDMNGKLVYERSEGIRTQGMNKLELNTEELAPGIYSYTITAGQQSITNKLVVAH